MMNLHRITKSYRPPDDGWIERTLLVQRCERLRSEIAEHKWYESERAGRDIGWHRATISYAIHQSKQRL